MGNRPPLEIPDSLVLTAAELESLTRKTERSQKRYDTQATELTAMGIPFLRRTDDTLAVLRIHVEPSGKTPQTRKAPPAVRL